MRKHSSTLHCSSVSAVAGVLLAGLLMANAHAEGPDAAPRWDGLTRVYAMARLFLGVARAGIPDDGTTTAGMMAEAGAEINTRSGLLIGAELAPVLVTVDRLQLGGRLRVGYATESIGVSVGLGTGLGGTLRLGRYDRTYATLRVSWASNLPLTIPVDIDLQVSTPLHPRVRLSVELDGGYGDVLSAYATGGVQFLLGGKGLRGTSLLSVGAGVSWVELSLGPMLSLGYERRF